MKMAQLSGLEGNVKVCGKDKSGKKRCFTHRFAFGRKRLDAKQIEKWNKSIGKAAKDAGLTVGKSGRVRKKPGNVGKSLTAAMIGMKLSTKSGAAMMLRKLTGGMKGSSKAAVKKVVCNPESAAAASLNSDHSVAKRKTAAASICKLLK
jgi:hypothetical protein